jgi:hypothetical protein
MSRRIRIPLLVDVAVVSDETEMARLNNEPAIGRRLSGKRAWLNRLIWKRISGTLSIGDSRLLPVFEPRDLAIREAAQQSAETRLSALASRPAPFDREAVAELARYVAGAELEGPVGVTVQQVVGRSLDPRYKASRESYDAARVVAAVLSACPVTALRGLWWRASGRLAISKQLIWDLAQGDPVVIHGTAIAMHNIVDSLNRMRAAMAATGGWHITPAEAVARALVAPPALLRECVRKSPSADRLRPGALVLFRLEKMHAGTACNDLAFSKREWSQCPAHAVVPRLLEDVWAAAVRERHSRRYSPHRSLLDRLVLRPVSRLYVWLNRRVPWYRLPSSLAFFNLWALRKILREQNLHDTSLLPSHRSGPPPEAHPDVLRWRTPDGSFNDLQDPNMGRAGTRFGRNVSLGFAYPDPPSLLHPNPRRVSRTLLARDTFTPATTLNVLAAAWIQFQVHDWFHHGDADPSESIDIPLDPDDPLGPGPLRIGRTRPDPTRCDDPPIGPPTFINAVTHWWDASQLYGSDQTTQRRVRSLRAGKLALDAQGRIPVERDTGVEVTGFSSNWWLGLSLLHQLFTLEHNAICDRLAADFPGWDDERLFQTARMVTAALITKIHDLEWVPAVLANPPVKRGLYATWWGLLGKWAATSLGRFPDSDMFSGIPGSRTDHHSAPYAITEEFVSVYRMHAFMMPEQFHVYAAADGALRTTVGLRSILGGSWRATLGGFDLADLLYSFGRNHPGALTLGNYPATFQHFQPIPGVGPIIDLAAVDILRDRERGVPRYNRFRELLHLPVIRTFEELNPEWAAKLRLVYDDVDQIDLMVGLFAESRPPGFGFSDTTFRIFLLMNSRRLKSDRFYTTDYRPAVYTQTGLDWIHENDMRTVLQRHYPSLDRVVRGTSNVFAPWPDARPD